MDELVLGKLLRNECEKEKLLHKIKLLEKDEGQGPCHDDGGWILPHVGQAVCGSRDDPLTDMEMTMIRKAHVARDKAMGLTPTLREKGDDKTEKLDKDLKEAADKTEKRDEKRVEQTLFDNFWFAECPDEPSEIRLPADVPSLEQWGKTVFLYGKTYVNLPYQEVLERGGKSYVRAMKTKLSKRQTSSSQLEDFLQFAVAKLDKEPEFVRKYAA